MSEFNISEITSQKGRTAIVTGANTGLGFETTRALGDRNESDNGLQGSKKSTGSNEPGP